MALTYPNQRDEYLSLLLAAIATPRAPFDHLLVLSGLSPRDAASSIVVGAAFLASRYNKGEASYPG